MADRSNGIVIHDEQSDTVHIGINKKTQEVAIRFGVGTKFEAMIETKAADMRDFAHKLLAACDRAEGKE